jgi:hypothetical protein
MRKFEVQTHEDTYDIEANFFKVENDVNNAPTFYRFMKLVRGEADVPTPRRYRIEALFSASQLVSIIDITNREESTNTGRFLDGPILPRVIRPARPTR